MSTVDAIQPGARQRAIALYATLRDTPIVLQRPNRDDPAIFVQRAEDHVRRLIAYGHESSLSGTQLQDVVMPFFLGGNDVWRVGAIASQLRGRVETFLTQLYVAASQRRTHSARSHVLAPTAGGRTRPTATGVKFLRGEASRQDARISMDLASRVVIKMYPLGPLSTDHGLEVVHEIVIGHYLTALVTSFPHTITPHFAQPLDWTVGPVAQGVNATASGLPTVAFADDEEEELMQYVAVEQADLTMHEYLTAADFTIETWVAIEFQTMFSLEAAGQTMGFVHNDFHFGNAMLRELWREPASPYTNRTWIYTRANKCVYTLRPHDHANLFLEIIDMGTARLLVSLPDTRDAHIIGPAHRQGESLPVAGNRFDCSRDVRHRGVLMLATVDLDAAVARSLAREPHPVSDARRAELVRMGEAAKAYVATMVDVRGFATDMISRAGAVRARASMGNVSHKIVDEIDEFAQTLAPLVYRRGETWAERPATADMYTTMRTIFTAPQLRRVMNLLIDLPAFLKLPHYASSTLAPTRLLNMPVFAHLMRPLDASDSIPRAPLHVGKVTISDMQFDPRTGKRYQLSEDVSEDSDDDDDWVDIWTTMPPDKKMRV